MAYPYRLQDLGMCPSLPAHLFNPKPTDIHSCLTVDPPPHGVNSLAQPFRPAVARARFISRSMCAISTRHPMLCATMITNRITSNVVISISLSSRVFLGLTAGDVKVKTVSAFNPDVIVVAIRDEGFTHDIRIVAVAASKKTQGMAIIGCDTDNDRFLGAAFAAS